MNEPAPLPAPPHPVALPELRTPRTGWRRAAEVAGIVAIGMLGAVGVIPW